MPQPDTYTVCTTNGSHHVSASAGYTLPHEHIIIDLRVWWEGPGEADTLDPVGQKLGPEQLADVAHHPQAVARENLVLSDWYLAAKELRDAKINGCQLVVDLTTDGLDPRPGFACKAAQLAGLDMVIGVGRYLTETLNEKERQVPARDLAERWTRQVSEGVDDLQVGIIGEIGTGTVIAEPEVASLQAAAWVQQDTGLPINVHVHPYARQALQAIRILDHAGADLSKVAISHCDGELDTSWLEQILNTSCYIEFDQFGTGPDRLIQGRGYPSDLERIDALTRLCDRGYADRILLSHDICMRNSLRHYGGWGYSHLGTTIAPKLATAIGAEGVQKLMNVNPLRLLSVDS